ncbi:Rieske 2Fe-2S domain-containing protein [Halobaculum sp. CBA1158]|uniref:Rieske (2Fe-2S) protein n=1 Tax=Halobaculum sp. CBA1158 TaxID=2904243 RepID=UPI001F28D70B|nr:Rieske 2Fe-2S domain-containing protein [Halobaculum sp. CBA1158]UIO98965.1 Rieske 2Fe-2S domain-containing protein [Halobaculum sp. CBA1158]
MTTGTTIASLADVPESGSLLFTVADGHAEDREAILVRCDEEPGVRAWINTCPHEYQRLDRGRGAAMRDGEIICPKHGSMFDACSGECDNGEAAGTTLPSVSVAVEDGEVLLADDDYTFRHEGGIDDDGPSSTSHIGF